jgi:hypothetical protein
MPVSQVLVGTVRIEINTKLTTRGVEYKTLTLNLAEEGFIYCIRNSNTYTQPYSSASTTSFDPSRLPRAEVPRQQWWMMYNTHGSSKRYSDCHIVVF